VYAQGAEAAIRNISIDNIDTIVGPRAPGAGVIGRGGIFEPRDEGDDTAPGVIGLAGDTAIPVFEETRNAGVFGKGPRGVYGRASTNQGIGVRGLSTNGPALSGHAQGRGGRGAQLSSTEAPQVWLVPIKHQAEFGNDSLASPPRVVASSSRPELPSEGRAGDLISIQDAAGECRLWFCTRAKEGGAPARWAEVLLGEPFDGMR
jgi:hypothetical protein